MYITTGAISKNTLTELVKQHRYAIICQVDIQRRHWDLAYTVGLGQLLLPELYIKLPADSPLFGTETGLIRTIVDRHRDNEITVGDIIEVPDSLRATVHEFSVIPVTTPYPLPGIAAVFPDGPSWTVEIFTSDCGCPFCQHHRPAP